MISSHASRLFTALRSPFPFIVGIALVFAACSDQTAPVDPIDESVDGIAEIQDLPEFHRGWGNPIVRLLLARTVLTEVDPRPPGDPNAPTWYGVRKHTVVAYQRQDDGTDAKGWTRLDQRGATQDDQTFSTRGRVVCMNKVEGTVFAFRDNGRGPNAGDESGFRLATNRLFAKLICQSPGDFGFTYDVAAGNLFPIERGFTKVID